MCMQELEYAKPSRALGEVGQTRTWNLMLDVIAQSGRYAPGATGFTSHWGATLFKPMALPAWGITSDGSVDVLGSQLEEVVE